MNYKKRPPWWSSGSDSSVSLQEAQVQSLVKEVPHAERSSQKKKREAGVGGWGGEWKNIQRSGECVVSEARGKVVNRVKSTERISEIYTLEKYSLQEGNHKICKLMTSHPIKINEGHEYSSQQKKNKHLKMKKNLNSQWKTCC